MNAAGDPKFLKDICMKYRLVKTFAPRPSHRLTNEKAGLPKEPGGQQHYSPNVTDGLLCRNRWCRQERRTIPLR